MSGSPHLRVVQVFCGAPLEEKRFAARSGAVVRVGADPKADFITDAARVPSPLSLFRARGESFSLHLLQHMHGTLHLGGRVEPVFGGALEHALAPGDWGIVALDERGELAFFFQVAQGDAPTLRPPWRIDRYLTSALILAGLVHAVILVAAFLLATDVVEEDLAAQPERVARLLLDKTWPEKPPKPEDDSDKPSRDKNKVKAEDMSKRAAGKEGKFGDPNAANRDTKLAKGPRDVIAAKVRNTGLLGAASKAKNDTALGRLLTATPTGDYTQAMAGVGPRTEIGQGSGGMGTRGGGTGGGGTGPGGQIHGIGNLDTGTGGNGRTHKPGGGAGRVAKEAAVSFTPGAASTDGSLSREQILKVVTSHQSAIAFCFEKELQRFPKLAGKVVLAWRVELDGTVSGAKVESSSLGHPPTEGCMVRQLKGWTFPKPQGTVAQVSFPFLFRAQ